MNEKQVLMVAVFMISDWNFQARFMVHKVKYINL